MMSIATQRNITNTNLKVYVVNDCDGTDYTDLLEPYRQWLNITYLVTPENVGSGLCRQYGIDHSTQEWISFIDSDDVFSSPYSISYLYDGVKETECDMLISDYYEERNCGDTLVELKRDVTRLHGKLYRRSYLEKNNIRFHDKLRLNEDGHFNTLAFRLSNAVAFLPFFSYVWCDNRSSLTRTGDYLNKYSYMYAWGMVDALEVLIKRNCSHLEQYERSILANFYYYKVSLHNSDFKGKFEDTEYDRYVKEFLSMCDINAVVYDNQEEMKETLQDMVNKMFGEGHKPVWDTFLNFLKTYLK